MKIVIDIPDEEVPNKQDILTVDLHFIDGTVCECTYPFEMQEPCEDCISREAMLAKKGYTETEEGWSGYTVNVEDIEDLPSVIPTQKIKVLERDEVARKLGAVDIYETHEWIILLNHLEYLGLKICEVEE